MAKPKSRPQLSFESAYMADDAAGIPEDHWCWSFFEYVYCALDDVQFAGMYEEGGRYPVSPSFLASLTLLQFMFGASDRAAVENTIMRRDWRIALGITCDYDGFHPTVLVRFRQRLVAHGMMDELFETVLGQMERLGMLRDRRRLRVDATHLVADVARLSRADAVSEAIRVVVSAAAKGYPELSQDEGFTKLHGQYGQECWVGMGDAGHERLVQLGRDGLWLLALLGQRPVKGKETLAALLEQHFIVDGEDDLRPRGPDDPGVPDPIVTPHEPDARRGRKGEKEWIGDKVHIVETAAQDGRPNAITDVLVTDPRVEDSTVTQQIAERARSGPSEADTLIADGGYASGANTAALAGMQMDLVAPPRANTRKGGKLSIEEFTIDFGRQVAICPEGHESVRWRERQRDIHIRFDTAVCRACPRRSQCTDSTRGRSLAPSLHYEQLQRDRARAQTEEFKALHRLRAPIEATISELVHRCGLRRSRYRGAPFRAFHAVAAVTALNVRRMLRWLATPDGRQAASAACSCRFLTAAERVLGAIRALWVTWAIRTPIAAIIRHPTAMRQQPI
jgi:hypothetical protein